LKVIESPEKSLNLNLQYVGIIALEFLHLITILTVQCK